MADERGAFIEGPVEVRLGRLEQAINALTERVSRLEGGFEQMSKRIENIERAVTQIQWSLVSGFLVTILAVILTRLLR